MALLFPEKPEPDHDILSPDTVRRIEDAAAAPDRRRHPEPDQRAGPSAPRRRLCPTSPGDARVPRPPARAGHALPPELAQLLTGQLGLLWQRP